MKHLAALLALSFAIVSVCSGSERKAYYLATNWTAVVQPQAVFSNNVLVATNLVTNMVGRIDPEEVPLPVIAAAAADKAGDGDSDLGFIITTITTLIASILAAWAKWQERRKTRLNNTLGQNIETYSEVTKAQPGGVELDRKIKLEIVSQQVEADVKEMAADVREDKVNPGAARQAAGRVMA